MEETSKTPEPEKKEEQTPAFRGLYRYVKIPVKALDAIIVVCILAILFVVALEMRNPGFTVTFDAKGGTDVPAQNQMYGDKLEMPEPPTREGYTFTGWHTDYGCFDPWDPETDTVKEDMTLYAGWEAKE